MQRSRIKIQWYFEDDAETAVCRKAQALGQIYKRSAFLYQEVPQEPTGFSPFEIVFGRTARGQMRILRHLWTQEDDDTDVRTTYQHVLELKDRLEHTTKIAREELR